VVSISPAAADERASTLSPPGIQSDAAWLTATTGATDPSQLAPQVWAIMARSDIAALVPFDLFNGLKKLSTTAALVWATTSGRGGPDHVHKAAAWPPPLSDFRVDRSWEGQPLPQIQQRLLWMAAGGWRFDVRVYFGTEHPSKTLLEVVQAELNRLTLPLR
jgi:hypothetical protein